MKKVSELKINDRFKNEKGIVLVVRAVFNNKIHATKETAIYPNGCVSYDFYDHNFEDLKNRVEMV
jgi:hypothetical protein